MLRGIIDNRKMIWKLAKNDFRTKYAGSYLGIVWAFVQPVVTILVYWLVFEFGLKSGSPVENTPYILWFVAGMVPWFFFSEALNNCTNCLLEYNYLVKKVVFEVSILPLVKILSSLFVHLVFIGFTIIIYAGYGRILTINYAELLYYVMCLIILILSLSYATSAMVVFAKDLGQVINIILQVGMWATPILWSYDILPKELLWLFKLNPMFYIINGYRDSFLTDTMPWDDKILFLYFWILVAVLFVIGVKAFKKLQVHFADVL